MLKGACAWQCSPTAASAMAGIAPVQEQDVGSAYSQQQASGQGWTWQRASPQLLSQEGLRRVEKGIRKVWKEAWAARWTSLATQQTQSTPTVAWCSWEEVGGDSSLPGISAVLNLPHGTGELRELDKKLTTKAAGYCLPMSLATTHLRSLFSRSANHLMAFWTISKLRFSLSLCMFSLLHLVAYTGIILLYKLRVFWGKWVVAGGQRDTKTPGHISWCMSSTLIQRGSLSLRLLMWLSLSPEDLAVNAHIPLLGWVLSGSESQILTWSWKNHVFFLFPHSKQETEKYNLLSSLQALLDALKKNKSELFLRCSFQGT